MNISTITYFNEHINGDWSRNTNIPDDKDDWGTFNIVREHNIQKEKKIMEDFLKDKNSKNNSFGLLYDKLLSINEASDTINIKRISDYLKLVDKMKELKELGSILGYFMNLNINPFFSVFVNEDTKQTDKLKLTLYIPSLSLPERSYYLDDNKVLIAHYKQNIVECFDIFNMFAGKDKKQYAEDIFKIEQMIAIIQKPIEEMREHDKLYHKTSISGFIDVMTSTCDKVFKLPDENDINHKKKIEMLWNNFFTISKLENANDIVIYDISFFRKITSLFQIVELDKIKVYIQYIVMRTMLNNITDIGDKILFKFFGKELSGRKKLIPRYERSIILLDDYIGEVIGKEFVTRHFDNDSKNIVLEMVEKIKEEMKISIINSTWMTGTTKEKALLKLGTFKTKIGYPEKWKSYDNLADRIKLSIDKDIPLVDIVNIMRNYTYELTVIKDIDGVKDQHKWSMNPQDVNAYYSPPRNEIVFPAGILQEPFFSKTNKPCENYGAIGVIIGHEITHGYDDQGRKYDHSGNIVNWWTNKDKKNFNIIANKMIDQYNNYKLHDMNINGKLTLGENLADLGGINLAIRALYKSCPDITLKDKQTFFNSYAICWRRLMTKGKQKQQIMGDPHSPAIFRIYMVRNIDEFYDVYINDKNNDDSLYLGKNDRIRMW